MTAAISWITLGGGTGAFTLALAELLGPSGEVIAVDRDRGPLRDLAGRVRSAGGAAVRTLVADFTRPLDLPPLHGVVLANSLHFVPRYKIRPRDGARSSTTLSNERFPGRLTLPSGVPMNPPRIGERSRGHAVMALHYGGAMRSASISSPSRRIKWICSLVNARAGDRSVK